MKNRLIIIPLFTFLILSSCAQENTNENIRKKFKTENMATKTDEEWKKELTPEQYHILREKGTERAFTGKYNMEKGEGIYVCAGCGNPLFSSENKYNSGSGWPSFWKPVEDGSVDNHSDNSLWMKRTEVVCSNCQGHLGHVFDDGPQPTGLRYCVNSAALDFRKEDQ